MCSDRIELDVALMLYGWKAVEKNGWGRRDVEESRDGMAAKDLAGTSSAAPNTNTSASSVHPNSIAKRQGKARHSASHLFFVVNTDLYGVSKALCVISQVNAASSFSWSFKIDATTIT